MKIKLTAQEAKQAIGIMVRELICSGPLSNPQGELEVIIEKEPIPYNEYVSLFDSYSARERNKIFLIKMGRQLLADKNQEFGLAEAKTWVENYIKKDFKI